ncbi:MAG: hypothetical protein MJ152_01135 [Clostridia bacterium]|nr:hypothetical protein [Clostridia bacterium]
MELIVLGSVFGVVWLVTLITFVVLYKKKSGTGVSGNIKEIVNAQKNQNEVVNAMIMQSLKLHGEQTQNTINNLSVLQKQEFDSISKRVDELTQ